MRTKNKLLKDSEDYFLYVTPEDEEETFEVLGLNKNRYNSEQEEKRIEFYDFE